MGQVNAPQLQTPMGYDPTTQLWLPYKTGPAQIDPVNGEEYGYLQTQPTITGAPGFIFKAVKGVAVTSGTGLSIWTPATGKRFRLLGFLLGPSGAFVSYALIFMDTVTYNTANEFIQTPPFYSSNYSPVLQNIGSNGYLSTAINNQLWIDVTASGSVSGFVYGTEE